MKKPREKDDNDFLFYRIRDVALRQVPPDPEFIAWLRSKGRAGLTFHHVCASIGSRKSTDLLGVMVTAEEHSAGQRDRVWLMEKIPEAIWNLICYVVYLKERIKWLEEKKVELELALTKDDNGKL